MSARRIHSLPTPISSFTVIAREQAAAEQLRDTPLLVALATRMQTRITMRTTRTQSAPPGMPVLAADANAGATALWNLGHGARSCSSFDGCADPLRSSGTGRRSGGLAPRVAASLLRPFRRIRALASREGNAQRERASRLRLLRTALPRTLAARPTFAPAEFGDRTRLGARVAVQNSML